MLLHECLGQSRVRSSLHTASSANFQPAERLRDSEATAPWFLSAAPGFTTPIPGPPAGFCRFSGMGSNLPITLFSALNGCTNDKMHIKSKSRGTRIQSAIFTEPVSLLLRSGAVGYMGTRSKVADGSPPRVAVDSS